MDAAVVPIGTGGVLGGISVACKKLKPDMKVFGAEPELADDAFQSLRTGQRIVFTGKLSVDYYISWCIFFKCVFVASMYESSRSENMMENFFVLNLVHYGIDNIFLKNDAWAKKRNSQ